ncbi:MAG: acyltransferase family protein [Gemmatimonadaceae bacterium]|nr:acyltransferase family protein [Gemmatimonadaceae bacterium]
MTQDDRFHGLDAARAFALLLGVVLHATMSFFLPIPAQDVSPSVALGVTFYVIHMFRMTLFFVIAGFFAHLAFHRRGARAFVKDRAKRIVVPMTVGWVILAPVTTAIVIWGLMRTFPDGAPADAPAPAPQGFPLTHLWFLYYLCVCYVLVLSARAAFVSLLDPKGTLRAAIDARFGALLRSAVAPQIFALPLFAVFVGDASWPAWFGIQTPDTGLMPQLPALAGFVTAFLVGWLLHRQTELLAVLERRWALHLGLAVALTAGCLAIMGSAPDLGAPSVVPGGARMRLLYAAAYTVAIWCWSFGVLGGALRFFRAERAAMRYLADASYWIYLAHLPVVFALQVLLMRWPMHWALKFPLIVGVTVGVLLLTYRWFVRGTIIGEVLNGRRVRASAAPSTPTMPATTAPLLAELAGVIKQFDKTVALDRVSVAVRAGELLALLGPNGAGKTTAIGLWLGTLEPDSGVATVMGGSPFDVHSRLGVGAMLQEVVLAPALTAREHLALTASYYRSPLSVDDTIALTGISAIADTRHGKLSTGQKRQVQFALAVVGRPQLIFLDEPTVGLDVQARETMWRAIRSLVASGTSVVLTTHYLEEAEALADRVVVLAKGRVIAEGSVDEIRAVVTRKRVSFASVLDADELRTWPGVIEAERDARLVHLTVADAEAVVRRLLASDPALSQLEVKQASLAEAFNELTKEAA